MRIVIAAHPWPAEAGDAWAAAGLVQHLWWQATDEHRIDAVGVADGSPSSALTYAPLEPVDGAEGIGAVRVGGAALLGTVAERFDPEQLRRALVSLAQAGEKRIVVPTGGLDTSSAGMERLAADPVAAVAVWGGDERGLRDALGAADLEVLVTTDVPLLGWSGMAGVLAGDYRMDPEAAQRVEAAWYGVTADRGDSPMLLGPAPHEAPGSAAGDGLAYCLAAVGGRLMPASSALIPMSEAVAGGADYETADLFVAVVPELDFAQADRGLVRAIADRAAAAGVPAIAIAGESALGRRDVMAAGLASVHTLREPGTLEATVRAVAQTWTPVR